MNTDQNVRPGFRVQPIVGQRPIRYYRCPKCRGEFVQPQCGPEAGYEGLCRECKTSPCNPADLCAGCRCGYAYQPPNAEINPPSGAQEKPR